ncbi:MAG: hypothetical protein ACLQEQ_05740 [Nitrososphaerales archaeon]
MAGFPREGNGIHVYIHPKDGGMRPVRKRRFLGREGKKKKKEKARERKEERQARRGSASS